jgi:hypothetical protein
MSFSIEITPNTQGAIVHAVIVTVDGHEAVVTFQSKRCGELRAGRAGQARGRRKECLAAGSRNRLPSLAGGGLPPRRRPSALVYG